MITTAVDNTIGPLSVFVAPLNVTRSLETKFSQPVKPEIEFIVVKARFMEREGPRLYFKADVLSPDGRRMARFNAVHWIIESETA